MDRTLYCGLRLVSDLSDISVVYTGIQLKSGEEHKGVDVDPYQDDEEGPDASIEGIVTWKVLKVNVESYRGCKREYRGKDRSGRDEPEFALTGRSEVIDEGYCKEIYGNKDQPTAEFQNVIGENTVEDAPGDQKL